MATYVPGYGTFDPDLPEWLILHTDGKLYNVNAANNRLRLTEPWTPPEDWRGDRDHRFMPEGSVVTPPPVDLPVEPVPVPPGVPLGPSPVLMHRLLAAMRAVLAHDRQLLDLARQRMDDDMAQMQEGLRRADEANKAFDAILVDLQTKVNPK